MSSPSLQRLWRLHEVDVAIVEIRKRAGALDPGKAIMSQIQKLEADYNVKHEATEKLFVKLLQLFIDALLLELEISLFAAKSFGRLMLDVIVSL